MQDKLTLWQEIQQEARPIIVHGTSILILLSFLFAIGACMLVLEHLFPKHSDIYDCIELMDLVAIAVIVGLFGVYTVVKVAMRALRGLQKEWRSGSDAEADNEQ